MSDIKRSIWLILILMVFYVSYTFAEDIAYTDRDIIRNGGFENTLYDAWHTYKCDFYGEGKSGGHALQLELSEYLYHRYCFQMLTIPSELDAASIRFDYQAEPNSEYEQDVPVRLDVIIAKAKSFDSANLEETPPLTTIGVVHSEVIESSFEWREFSANLEQTIIDGMQAAHDAGEFVFLLFFGEVTVDDLDMLEAGLDLDIDNLSFTINGTQLVPEMQGKVAYHKTNDEGKPVSVALLDPNTREVNTIWTHPDGEFGHWSNITWHPDATSLAFISDHDFKFSIFRADIFSIKPDGSGLHRVPDFFNQEEAEDGDCPHVTVKGVLEFDTSNTSISYFVVLGIQGTDKGAALSGSYGSRVPFSIPDVPVLGDPNTFDQMFVLQYSGSLCSMGIEYYPAMGMVVNNTVDVGTVKLFGANCIGLLAASYPHSLSYNHDGTEIGFTFLGLRRVSVEATGEFAITEINPPSGGSLVTAFAYSPVDNRYLYTDYNFASGGDRLFLGEEGQEPQLMVERDINSANPVWLPDGSGFVYAGPPEDEFVDFDDTIFQYDTVTNEKTRLTYFHLEQIQELAISPDGRHILFQFGDYDHSDFWILDRLNPVEIWPANENSNCTHPDWSPKDVVLDTDDDTPNDDRDDDTPDDDSDGNGGSNTDGPGGGDGGGGGGCFVTILI